MDGIIVQCSGERMEEINKKSLEAKKNHHHVWANYMKRWSPDDKNIYYTTKKNKKTVFDSVRNVAVERDFYRVQYIAPEHIQVIKMWSSKSPEDLQRLHLSYLSRFIKMQHMESVYKRSGIKDELADRMSEAWKCNGIENLHTAHEYEVQGVLKSLANRDLSVLDDNDNMINFMQFHAQQITRTKTFRDTCIASVTRADRLTDKNLAKAMRESWWFLSYMIGMNIGRSQYLDRNNDVHCLLINDTNTPFITSDQPVINVHQALTDEIKLPEDHECDEYYPISPNVAYMVNKSNRFPRGKVQVSVDVVEEMNIKIAKKANIHIISSSEESLKPYKKYIGSNLNAVKAL